MGFEVYRSSAGSGKTFTLVRDYLKLLVDGPADFRHILAVTFTNKAADEMKQRIIHNLASLGGIEGDPKGDMYKALLEQGVSEGDIEARSRLSLKLILHEYHDFAVGTIDSFMHRVLRTFARDLRIPSGFEVGLESDETAEMVSELLFDRVGTDDELTLVMKAFTRHKIMDERSADLEKALRDYVGILLHEDSREPLKLLGEWPAQKFFDLVKSLREKISKRDAQLHMLAREGLDLLLRFGLEDRHFKGKSLGLGGYLRKISRVPLLDAEPYKAVAQCGESGDWAHHKLNAEEKAAVENAYPQLNKIWSSISELLDARQDQMDEKLISDHLYLVALANAIRAALLELRDEENYLPVNDINSLVADVALKEAVPFIYERLGEKYRHFLLDEFQDTSVLQWHNLVPLLENGISAGGHALVVGDSKQSIYRWRSGDAEQFRKLPKISGRLEYPLLEERERPFVSNYIERKLDKNYRSAGELVDFNNAFFSYAAERLPESVRPAYKGLEQEAVKIDMPGKISISIIDPDDGEIHSAYAEKLLSYVRELVERHPLSDIAVLCRNNKDASTMAEHLLSSGYPVISAESVLLGASARVRVLIGSIRLLDEPDNRLIRVELARDLQVAGLLGEQPLQEALREPGLRSGDEPEQFIQWLGSKGFVIKSAVLASLSLYELAEELVRLYHFNDTGDVYLQFLLENIQDLPEKWNAGLNSFLQWWDEHGYKKSVNVPAGMEAISILTIHKAKGLEFPVVIYPVFPENHKLTRNEQWFETDPVHFNGLRVTYLQLTNNLEKSSWYRELLTEQSKTALDILNIHYVAMTRPKQELYIILDTPSESKSKSMLKEMSLNKALTGFLSQKYKWEVDQGDFSVGESTAKKRAGQPGGPGQETFHLSSWPWEDRLHLRYRAPEYWEAGKEGEATSHGLLAHRVMASIHQAGDKDAALDKAVRSGLLREDEKDELDHQISRILESKELRDYFLPAWKVYNEQELLLPGGDILRPDRVVMRDNQAVVIDYKTGTPNERHKQQIGNYAGILSAMGSSEVQAFLAYLPSGTILEVPV